MITFPGRYYVWILLYVAFCTIMAISRHKEARIRDYALYSYVEWLQGFFIAHSAIGSTVHSRPLNSVEHCICTTTMTNIRPDRDSNLVLPGNKPQSIRMSHRGQPSGSVNGSTSVGNPADEIRWINVVLMLGQRRRWWLNLTHHWVKAVLFVCWEGCVIVWKQNHKIYDTLSC